MRLANLFRCSFIFGLVLLGNSSDLQAKENLHWMPTGRRFLLGEENLFLLQSFRFEKDGYPSKWINRNFRLRSSVDRLGEDDSWVAGRTRVNPSNMTSEETPFVFFSENSDSTPMWDTQAFVFSNFTMGFLLTNEGSEYHFPSVFQNPKCKRTPVEFVRYNGEQSAFKLLDCSGSVSLQAMDKLSIFARPPEVKAPETELPFDPLPKSWEEKGEWVDNIKLVHPRLIWLIQNIADALPNRSIYIYSGYRPIGKDVSSHKSFHGKGKALDIHLMGVNNEDLFRFCRKLMDVGCGYYPNSKFVHVDVRPKDSGHPFWVDISSPGESSVFVDRWPGVVEPR